MIEEPVSSTSGSRFRLLGDQPHIAEEDPLGFDRFAEDLVRLILTSRRSSPFTLGVEGGWGMGKSSLMRQIAGRLEEPPEVRTVWFNAWSAEEGTALEGLMKSVLDELDPSILRRAMRNEKLMGMLGVAVSVAAAWFGLGTLADRVWQRMSVDPKARNRIGDVLRDAMEDWRSKGAERMLVVFVDDLDRCSPTNVFQIFEAIKLYLDAPGMVFVVGFDQGIVSEAILEQKRYSKAVTSDSYLEKIVQITFRVPTPGDEEVQQLLDAYTNASRTAELFPEAARSLVIERNQRNPRRIKRFINRFVLEYDLDPDWSELGPETLVRILIIHMYFPAFGRLLDARADSDPVGEFLEFTHVRGVLRDPGARDDQQRWDAVQRAFAARELPLAGNDERTSAELLVELERTVPEGFSDLAGNAEFRSLVEGLGDESTRARLRDKFHRGRTAALQEPDVGEDYEFVLDDVSLRARRILWVDERPANIARIAERLKDRGADVITARDDEEMAASLTGVDLLISDVGRGASKTAGFDALARLREERAYDGPAIFYTSFVTPARRQEARALRAEITDQPVELMLLVTRLLKEPEPEPATAAQRGSVFLSYRRGDSAAYAGRLRDHLAERFGDERIFLDIEGLQHGTSFPDAIRQSVEAADVILALIGPGWLEARRDGARLIDDPSDFVRLELAMAFSAGKPVIPVLVAGARMPGPSELPPDVARLAELHAFELRDMAWAHDAAGLANLVAGALRER